MMPCMEGLPFASANTAILQVVENSAVYGIATSACGHFDLSVALKATEPPELTVHEIDDVVEGIEKLLGDIYSQLRPGYTQSFTIIGGDDHVKRFLTRIANRVS